VVIFLRKILELRNEFKYRLKVMVRRDIDFCEVLSSYRGNRKVMGKHLQITVRDQRFTKKEREVIERLFLSYWGGFKRTRMDQSGTVNSWQQKKSLADPEITKHYHFRIEYS
jgi:hypothetical protein